MNTPATDRAPSSSPRATSGGTPPSLHHQTSHDDKHHFLLKQNPRELVRAIASENSATASSNNIEQPQSAINPPLSSSLSPSASVFQRQHSSHSSHSFNQLQGLSENFGHINIDSSVVPPEALPKRRTRVRELSAPLPFVPPSTPASAASKRSSFSQSQHQPSVSPSFLRHGSPLFSSPLTELSDSEEQDTSELSDSNSVEIISGYVVDPFVTGRYKDASNVSRGFSQSTRSSYSTALSPSSMSVRSGGDMSNVARETSNLPSLTSSASQTPTPHPFSHTSSPSHVNDNEQKSTIETSNSSPISRASNGSSATKSASSSRAHPRTAVRTASRLSSETSSSLFEKASAAAVASVDQNQDHKIIPEMESTQDSEDTLRTPNVYVNGLPPHFPDESLYLMTRDFGHVLSVRTFTRCVGDKMSGYGFVLFDSVDAAGKCIETLRKYRNLHPSFSKQVHKIPGTPYASGTITLPPVGSLPSLATQPSMSAMSSFPSMASTLVSSGTSSSLVNHPSPIKNHGHNVCKSISTTSGSDFEGKELSFNEKMERLKDVRSTNLYMEGLPLTIDDVSLSALVSPHKVVSSRFFQTKLSNPPRMIAFVRLETRPGAEEVIERLHGRVVRGWNDNGCRISVRFADTNEQRELRRTERLNRGEEDEANGGAQLSMAHAALLNLRGAEAQAHLGNHPHQQLAHLPQYDDRSPLTLQAPQHANLSHAVSDFRNANSFHHMTGTHSGSGGNSGMRSKAHNAAQQIHHPSSFPQQSRVISMNAPNPAITFDSQMGPADKAWTGKRNVEHHSMDNGGFSKAIDAGQLAALQQQNQLHQLQLLRQMQNAGLDTSYAFNNHGIEQAHALMPSADIMTNQMSDSHLQTDANSFQSPQMTHGRQGSLSNVQQRHARSYSKSGGISDHSGSALSSANSDHYSARRAANDHLEVRHQHQYSTNQSPPSPASGYPSHYLRSGAEHYDGMINNSGHRRGTTLEEGEVTLISPALTYASRTPSTLSPATPLFNTFGTPAAPATVPRGKTNVRERDYSRLYKNEHRQ